jgi:ATP-dependent helicase Lhr and Lhr-like helicase
MPGMENTPPDRRHHPSLDGFHAPVRDWFSANFEAPTRPQQMGWPVIQSGANTLLLSPTGSGKTLAAFLAAIDRVMFDPVPGHDRRCRVLYLSPLKALAVDVEKNLREPLRGIANTAVRGDIPVHLPEIALRTGDTPSRERAAFQRRPTDFLITTPESLFLMLTSQVRDRLRGIRYVIVDEIHSMVGTKRGSHLALSLERLAETVDAPFQRIGLSATQRPLEEVARFLGGFEGADERPVSIVDAGAGKQLEIRVMMPASELVSEPEPGDGSKTPPSIWAGIHPFILEQINSHRTTLIFVNSRRLAERLALALNELAGSEIVHAHHGSLAKEQRLLVEEALKSGRLPALVATSSLELGIDMGSIDLVIQVEAPYSVSSALQRIGRAGHQVGETSSGLLLPKFRGDLLACAALSASMIRGEVEPMHYPRNPLDVLAQQVVAMVSVEDWTVEALEGLVHRAAPFRELPGSLFAEVLDMLSGRYPSDEFAQLRPRITWDRATGRLSARHGAKRVAIANAGTIPDRGHYGVYRTGTNDAKGRIGELDEEMVFETKVGDTFLLGATSWRVDEITQDRVFVTAAHGQGGRMPFWHGDNAGRPPEFGRAIGALTRQVTALPPAHAMALLMGDYHLDEEAAHTLIHYLKEQEKAGALPDDRTLVVETYRDENNDWRMCLLSPFGSRVHAPLAMAVGARIYDQTGKEADILWMDDGIVVRLPETELPPDPSLFFPDPEELEELVVRQLGVGGGGARAVNLGAPVNALFASRFREAAARALLLPRRAPGKRSPLWQQRKRAADLLRVTAEFGSFPIVLEAFREILQDDFDLPALTALLHEVRRKDIRVVHVTNPAPSPFAASLFFHYIANFMYEGDAPSAERRAQALQVDPVQLRSLLGTTEMRALLEPDAIADWERRLQHLTPERTARHPDGLHDLLLDLGDLTEQEVAERIAYPDQARAWIDLLVEGSRAARVSIAGEERIIAVEDASRYRDALGLEVPADLPSALLAPVRDAIGDLVGRYARTHGPFTADECARRFGMGISPILAALHAMAARGKVIEGEFRPDGVDKEWCEAGVLRTIRQTSLQHLRREVEPVDEVALARLYVDWQGVGAERTRDIVQVLEPLQGAELPASILESQILAARLPDYDADDLDSLFASGELVWIARRSRGAHDGWIRLFLADNLSLLLEPPAENGEEPPSTVRSGSPVVGSPRGEAEAGGSLAPGDDVHDAIRDVLAKRGASFFPQILAGVGGFPAAVLDALWELVWDGEVTNDTLQPLRALVRPPDPARERRAAAARGSYGRAPLSGRRSTPLEAAGRWSLVRSLLLDAPTPTARATARVRQLLARFGVVARETIQGEALPGGFSAAYPVLRAMEESGRIRRGFFVEGLGALQFALPGALERLRALRDPPGEPRTVLLAACDPANPYGLVLPWPPRSGTRRANRAVGARVILVDGFPAGWLSPDEKQLVTFLEAMDEGPRERAVEALAAALGAEVDTLKRRAFLLEGVDDLKQAAEPLHSALLAAGFIHRGDGYQKRLG